MNDMNVRKICFACMSPLPEERGICPACGYDNQVMWNKPHQLTFSRLGNRYLVGRAMGQGGFGITYVGLDLTLNRKVAIKEYYPRENVARTVKDTSQVSPIDEEDEAVFQQGLEKFVAEAQTLARLADAENVVRVTDHFRANNTAYIVMDYVQGHTVKEMVAAAGGKLPPAQAVALMLPVARALKAIHDAGIIHRDISPDNIVIRERDGKPILIDFGAARKYSADESKHYSIYLKQGFAPIEQYSSSSRQGAPTDIYALCASLYYMITGRPPAQSLARSIGQETLIPPSKLCAEMPPRIEAVLLRGMAMDAKDRYPDMDALADALERALAEAKETEQERRQRLRKKLLPAAGLALAAVIGIVGWIAWPKPPEVVQSGTHRAESPSAEPAAVVTVTATPSPTATPTATATPVPTATPTATPAPTATPTATPTPAPTLSAEAAKLAAEISGGKTSEIQFGGYQWRVLAVQEDMALLLTEDVIEEKAYNEDFVDTRWETCTLRQYLNGKFYESFSPGEQAMIVETADVPADSQRRQTNENGLSDKISLLSVEELKMYFGEGELLPANRLVAKFEGETCNWWLRSQGHDIRMAAYVRSYGGLDEYGCSVHNIVGVRPALWVKLGPSIVGAAAPTATPTPAPTFTPISIPDVIPTEIKIKGIRYSTSVKELNLENNFLTSEDIEPLKYMIHLTSLNLDHNDITDVSVLGGLINLTELHLWNNEISDISALSGLKNLTFLTLGQNVVKDIRPLSELTNLKALYLYQTGAKDIRPLSGLVNLENLSLWGNGISDISPLSGLTKLTKLVLLENNISDISPLSGLTRLADLRIRDNKIRDISTLSQLKNLQEVDLSGNPITDWSPVSHVPKVTK